MSAFHEGLEAAARLVEQDGGLFGKDLAKKIRGIEETSSATGVTLISGVDAMFERFKEAYPSGLRNHWVPARKAFERALKKHKAEVIISGTQAFAASGKRREFIEAPAVFLNQARYLTQYDPAPSMLGSNGLFAIEEAFDRIHS